MKRQNLTYQEQEGHEMPDYYHTKTKEVLFNRLLVTQKAFLKKILFC